MSADNCVLILEDNQNFYVGEASMNLLENFETSEERAFVREWEIKQKAFGSLSEALLYADKVAITEQTEYGIIRSKFPSKPKDEIKLFLEELMKRTENLRAKNEQIREELQDLVEDIQDFYSMVYPNK